MGVHAMNHGKRKALRGWLDFGHHGRRLAAFVVLHMTEWMNLIKNEHVTPFDNPWGDPLFGGTFFALTGLHMTHVIIGLIYLGIIAFAVARGKFKAEDVEVSGLYWHFARSGVDVHLPALVYLMSAKI